MDEGYAWRMQTAMKIFARSHVTPNAVVTASFGWR